MQRPATLQAGPSNGHSETFDTDTSVFQRYASAAQQHEATLCCHVEYPQDYLAAIPEEILEKDYGCGDASPYVRTGETVLDLGSGGGKLCYILAQVVGPEGRVIGVDCNAEMLALARKYQKEVAERLGFANVDFRYGRIQDLRLDLDLLSARLSEQPIDSPEAWLAFRSVEDRLRREHPLVADESVDCVVSNCVLNLVRQQDRSQLFAEIFRVLRPGGRAAISDIVSDRDVPEEMQQDGELWSGCLSGAFREDLFPKAFEEAGFYGIEIVKRQREPWRIVEGIEFRSVTVLAHKGEALPNTDLHYAVIYKGPFRTVQDDEGNVFVRGERTVVPKHTLKLLQREPYIGRFESVALRDSDHLQRGAVSTESSCCSPAEGCYQEINPSSVPLESSPC